AERFARLRVTTGEGQSVDMDLAVDWRESEPVTLSIGPVLSLGDAVGNKVSALYSRAEARDYLDVDAIRASGKFTDQELIGSAAERDAGFEVAMFARQLDQVQRLTPERVAEYGVDVAQLDAIKGLFEHRATITAALTSPRSRRDSTATDERTLPERLVGRGQGSTPCPGKAIKEPRHRQRENPTTAQLPHRYQPSGHVIVDIAACLRTPRILAAQSAERLWPRR
ncbi:MAG: hypothetical protein ABI662_08265, partial [Dermatophilaceae bacterium]